MILFKKQFAVTASDTVPDPNGPFDGLMVGAAGNATILAEGDATARAYTGLAAGQYIPGRISRVNSGSLTATLYGVKI